MLSSQTIGVEFASRIIKVGTGARRKRIKLQLWDTAGTERFRSVSRSYYRGAAGAILVYDLASHASFEALPTFLNDARALASPDLTLLLAGNKIDLADSHQSNGQPTEQYPSSPGTTSSRRSKYVPETGGERQPSVSSRSSIGYNLGSQLTATMAPDGRAVSSAEASRWASRASIPVSVEVSAFTGEGVEEIFGRLAGIILTKIELGEIDPDDPLSGIQYGDSGGFEDSGSVRSGKRRGYETARGSGMREWEAVFRLDGSGRRRRGGCC